MQTIKHFDVTKKIIKEQKSGKCCVSPLSFVCLLDLQMKVDSLKTFLRVIGCDEDKR